MGKRFKLYGLFTFAGKCPDYVTLRRLVPRATTRHRVACNPGFQQQVPDGRVERAERRRRRHRDDHAVESGCFSVGEARRLHARRNADVRTVVSCIGTLVAWYWNRTRDIDLIVMNSHANT